MSRIVNLEATAKIKAVDRISNLIQRPDQLEKVDEFKKRETRKKASKEALLKTALQSQLDGIRMGLELMKSARNDLNSVKIYIGEIQNGMKSVPQLSKSLDEIREESLRHSQYAMAMENMNNIFNISKNLEKAHSLINEGNLLHAHILLSELEGSRDELLCELFRMKNNTEHKMLLDYFSDVEKLSDTLERQLKLNLKRTINTARKEPAILVTTLRIIEREEKSDALAVQEFDRSGFKSPGRPKKWKTKAFKILEDSVTERLEASQLDSRAENKLWLIRYLEVMRQLIVQDLLVVKSLCVPCFPPSYNILNRYIDMYHRCLSKLLHECISNKLEGNEYVSLLSWVLNTYTGPELLGSPQLDIHPDALPKDLLDKKTIEQLMRDYLKNIGENYYAWRMKTVSKEVEEWWNNRSPQADADDHYHTDAPVLIFKMVNENLEVAKTVSPELVQEMLQLSLEMVREYGQAYQNEVRDFKEKYFEDRSKVEFTQFMIAIVNNCLNCIELAHQTKERYWKSAINTASNFEAVQQTFENLQNKAAGYLLEEAFLDIEPHFQDIVTRPWLQKSNTAIDTISATLEDYFQDYNHLKKKNFVLVMANAKELVAKKYLLALMSKKLALKSQEERKECSERITSEAEKIRKLFEKVGCPSDGNKCPFKAIEDLAEVIKVEDLDMMSLELHSLIKHYPDITKEQLVAILSLRGDIGRFDLKAKVTEIIPTGTLQSGHRPLSIFSQVHIPPSIFN